MKKLETLIKRRDSLEERLMNEKLRLHKQISNLGWGAGMRRVKITPSFRKEDSLLEKLNNVNLQIKELQNQFEPIK